MAERSASEALDELNKPEHIGDCDCCHTEAVPVKFYRSNNVRLYPEGRVLCDICAGTFVGNISEYPGQHVDPMTAQAIAGVAWKIVRMLQPLQHNALANWIALANKADAMVQPVPDYTYNSFTKGEYLQIKGVWFKIIAQGPVNLELELMSADDIEAMKGGKA